MKKFTTYEEQLDLLKKQGLIINDETLFLEKLKDIGFYNLINGYAKIFKNTEHLYLKDVSADDILALYNFDKNLRNIVYKYTLKFESRFKSHISYVFSKYHGEDDKKYLIRENFDKDINKERDIIKLLNTLNELIKISSDKQSNRYRNYIGHYVTTHKHVPLWVLVRTMTVGEISKFYHCMQLNEREEVAKEFGITSGQLENMSRIIVEFRNVVAHDERLFCKKLLKNRLTNNLIIFDIMKIEKNKNGLPKSGIIDFLALMITFKYLLKPLDFAGFWYEFNVERNILIKNIKSHFVATINNEMGLKNRWKNLENFNHKKFFYINKD